MGKTSQLDKFLAVPGSLVLPQSMIVPINKMEALTRPKLSVTKPPCDPLTPLVVPLLLDVGFNRGTLLFISVKTVESHVSAVLCKLQLSSRHELTAWALERKLL